MDYISDSNQVMASKDVWSTVIIMFWHMSIMTMLRYVVCLFFNLPPPAVRYWYQMYIVRQYLRDIISPLNPSGFLFLLHLSLLSLSVLCTYCPTSLSPSFSFSSDGDIWPRCCGVLSESIQYFSPAFPLAGQKNNPALYSQDVKSCRVCCVGHLRWMYTHTPKFLWGYCRTE